MSLSTMHRNQLHSAVKHGMQLGYFRVRVPHFLNRSETKKPDSTTFLAVRKAGGSSCSQ